MNRPSVYMMCLHPLVCDALFSFLSQTDIWIVGRSSNADHGLAEIERLQPQVILLEGGDAALQLEEALQAYVRLKPGRRLLILDPDRNVLSIYTRRDQVIRDSNDLVAALKMP